MYLCLRFHWLWSFKKQKRNHDQRHAGNLLLREICEFLCWFLLSINNVSMRQSVDSSSDGFFDLPPSFYVMVIKCWKNTFIIKARVGECISGPAAASVCPPVEVSGRGPVPVYSTSAQWSLYTLPGRYHHIQPRHLYLCAPLPSLPNISYQQIMQTCKVSNVWLCMEKALSTAFSIKKACPKTPFFVSINLFWTLSNITYMSDTDKAWPGLTS